MVATFFVEPTGECSFCGRADGERAVVGVAARPWRACTECVGAFVVLIDRFETGTPAPQRTSIPSDKPTSRVDFEKLMDDISAKNLALHRQLGMSDGEIERRREWERVTKAIRAELSAPASPSNGNRRFGEHIARLRPHGVPRFTCSFCDASPEHLGGLLPGPQVAICADCARSAAAQLG